MHKFDWGGQGVLGRSQGLRTYSTLHALGDLGPLVSALWDEEAGAGL